MSFYAERQIKKTKKDHRCVGCCQIIPAGSPAIYIANSEPDFSYGHICTACTDYMNKYDDHLDDDGCWSEGDIGEARRERGRLGA